MNIERLDVGCSDIGSWSEWSPPKSNLVKVFIVLCSNFVWSRSTLLVIVSFFSALMLVPLTGCKAPAPTDTEVQEAVAAPVAVERVADEPGAHGGRLRIGLTSDLRTFNPLDLRSAASYLIADLMFEDLISFHPESQTFKPTLAESWGPVEADDGEADDGEAEVVTYRLKLHPGLKFSDGEPFDVDDVLFTLRAIQDPATRSIFRSSLVDQEDRPLALRKVDPLTLEIEIPQVSSEVASGFMFDRIYMLPEHKLASAYGAGELGAAWGAGSDPSELVGLGPFQLKDYRPGERLVLVRNPHYYGRDAAGKALPYLDEIVVDIVPDQQAAVMRWEAGDIDLLETLPPQAYERFAGAEGRLEALDVGGGTAYEFLFFNQNQTGDEEFELRRKWFRNESFRRAVSRAVDRRGIADLVYSGRATPVVGIISPADRRWSVDIEVPDVSVEAARRLLEEAGFSWDASGRLIDPDGTAVSFTLTTNASNRRRVQIATVVQEDLGRLGMDVQVVTLDFSVYVDRIYGTFEYDVGLLGLGQGGIDPVVVMEMLRPGGSNHLWHVDVETCPSTPWEEEIFSLMVRQRAEVDFAERYRLFGQVQRLIAEHQPVVPLIAPNVLVGVDRNLGNVAPTIFDPPVLWNVERLFWRDDRD